MADARYLVATLRLFGMHFLTPTECHEWDARRPRLGALQAKPAISRDFTASLRFCEAVVQGNEELVHEFLSLTKPA